MRIENLIDQGRHILRRPITWLYVFAIALVAVMVNTLFSLRQDRLFEQSRDFPEILHLVDIAYVDEVDMSNLMPAAFQGALERLDDNASYLPPGVPPRDMRELVFQRTGMVVVKQDGYAYAQVVATDSAAAVAGVKTGDFLRTISEKNTRQLSLHQIQSLLTEESEYLEVEVLDIKTGKGIAHEIRPGSEFEIPRLQHQAFADGLHHIRLGWFYPGFEDEIRKLISEFKEPNPKLLLDLRGNAMGDETALRTLASLFLPKGAIGAWINARKESLDLVNTAEPAIKDGELFVLVDESTSQASEQFGAAAQDLKKAQVIGRPTLGHADQYRAIPLKSGGHVVISTRGFKRVSDEMLTGKGFKPEVTITDVDGDSEEDQLLQKTLETIRSQPLKKAS